MDKDIAISVKNACPVPYAIKVTGVSKTFKIPHEKVSSLRGAVNLKEEVFIGGISLCSIDNESLFFSAIDRMLKYATIKLLKSPVLTLWAWRGFILQNKTI